MLLLYHGQELCPPHLAARRHSALNGLLPFRRFAVSPQVRRSGPHDTQIHKMYVQCKAYIFKLDIKRKTQNSSKTFQKRKYYYSCPLSSQLSLLSPCTAVHHVHCTLCNDVPWCSCISCISCTFQEVVAPLAKLRVSESSRSSAECMSNCSSTHMTSIDVEGDREKEEDSDEDLDLEWESADSDGDWQDEHANSSGAPGAVGGVTVARAVALSTAPAPPSVSSVSGTSCCPKARKRKRRRDPLAAEALRDEHKRALRE